MKLNLFIKHVPLLGTVFLSALLLMGCAGLEDPFQTFYSPGYQNTISTTPLYLGAALPPATVDPSVEYVQIVSLEQAKAVGRAFADRGYRRIGMSMFESNWPTPHPEAAARMGRKLGADLVAYAVIGVGTRLESMPHVQYEPGQSFTGSASGFVGGKYGSISTYGRTSGSFHTQFVPEEIGRYLHVAHYLVKINKPR
jgi:hypothetical protein